MACIQRFVLVFFLCTGACLVTSIRTAFKVGIAFMKKNEVLRDPCHRLLEEGTHSLNKLPCYTSPKIHEDVILFFWYGYILGQVPGGMLCDLYGGRHVLGFSISLMAVASLLLPFTCDNYYVFIGLRFLDGLFQSPVYPCILSILARWAPPSEAGRMVACAQAGSSLGMAFGILMGTFGIKENGWGFPFYLVGSFSILWYLGWLICCYSSPFSHPYISNKEFEYLDNVLPDVNFPSCREIPWRELVTSIPVYAILSGQVAADWVYIVAQGSLSQYFQHILRISVEETGIFFSTMFFSMLICTIVWGIAFDKIEEKSLMKPVTSRRIFVALATGFLVGLACGCLIEAAVPCFYLSVACIGFRYVLAVAELEITRTYAGTIHGIINGASSLIALLMSFISSRLAGRDANATEWKWLFSLSFAGAVLLSLGYIFFAGKRADPFDPAYIDKSLSRSK